MLSCRLFIHENLPQLKYHNPHVKFSVSAHREAESRVELLYGRIAPRFLSCDQLSGHVTIHPSSSTSPDDGSSQSIGTTGLRQPSIKDKIEDGVAGTTEQ